MRCERCGAIKGGRLKEAKIVRQSRTVKRKNVGRGTGRGVDPGAAKRRVNWLSLYRHSARFVVEVARNFGVPLVCSPSAPFLVSEEDDGPLSVIAAVSMLFAVKYVPKYKVKIRAKGLLPMKRCGFANNSIALFFKLVPSVFLPLAFSIMPLSIMVMIGATSMPALPAERASTPMRRPSLDVFHSVGVSLEVVGVRIAGIGSFGLGIVIEDVAIVD
jgi:hypothetical protein